MQSTWSVTVQVWLSLAVHVWRVRSPPTSAAVPVVYRSLFRISRTQEYHPTQPSNEMLVHSILLFFFRYDFSQVLSSCCAKRTNTIADECTQWISAFDRSEKQLVFFGWYWTTTIGQRWAHCRSWWEHSGKNLRVLVFCSFPVQSFVLPYLSSCARSCCMSVAMMIDHRRPFIRLPLGLVSSLLVKHSSISSWYRQRSTPSKRWTLHTFSI